MLLSIFFASVGIGFAYIGYLNFAFSFLLLGHIVALFFGKFSQLFELNEAQKAFGLELDAICHLLIYVILPASILLSASRGNSLGLLISSLYILAGVYRLAHFNRSAKYIESAPHGYTWGMPFELVAIIMPVLGLLGYLIKGQVYSLCLMVVMLLMAFAFILRVKVPKLSSQYLLFITSGQVLMILVFLFWNHTV